MTNTIFVNRENELNEVIAWSKLDLKPNIICLYSPSGLGKTSFLAELSRQINDNDDTVLAIDLSNQLLRSPLGIYRFLKNQFESSTNLDKTLKKIDRLLLKTDDKKISSDVFHILTDLAGSFIPGVGGATNIVKRNLDDRKQLEDSIYISEFLIELENALYSDLNQQLSGNKKDKNAILLIDSIDRWCSFLGYTVINRIVLKLADFVSILISGNDKKQLNSHQRALSEKFVNEPGNINWIVLKELESKDSLSFLEKTGVYHKSIRKELSKLACGNPLALQISAQCFKQLKLNESQKITSKIDELKSEVKEHLASDILVERALKLYQKIDPEINNMIESLCITRWFDFKTVSFIADLSLLEARMKFNIISSLPFVTCNSGRCQFHDLIRRLVTSDLRYDGQRFKELHQKYYTFYADRSNIDINGSSKLFKIESLYHMSYLDSKNFLSMILDLFLEFTKKYDIDFYPLLSDCLQDTELPQKETWVTYIDGRIANDHDLTEEAIKKYTEVLKNEKAPELLKAHASLSLAYVHIIDKGDLIKSRVFFEQSNNYFSILNDKSGQGYVLTGMGRAELHAGNVLSGKNILYNAIEHYTKIQTEKEVHHDFGLAMRYAGWAECISGSGEKGRELLVKSSDIHETSGCYYEKAEDLRLLARLEFSQGHIEQAIDYLNAAKNIFESLNLPYHCFHYVICLSDLVRIYSLTNKTERIIGLLELADSLYVLDEQKIANIELLLAKSTFAFVKNDHEQGEQYALNALQEAENISYVPGILSSLATCSSVYMLNSEDFQKELKDTLSRIKTEWKKYSASNELESNFVLLTLFNNIKSIVEHPCYDEIET